MRTIHRHRHVTPFIGYEAICLPVAVHRIGEVGRAIHEEDWEIHSAHVATRIKEAEPAFTRVGRHRGQRLVRPITVRAEESAAVNRHRNFEARIHSRHDAGEITAPADARNSNAIRVNVRQRSQQRMPAHHRRDGVLRPHLTRLGFGEVTELHCIRLVRSAIWQSADWPIAREIHRQCHIAAPRPMLRPILERLPSPAMHQDHRRTRSRYRIGGSTEIREDTRRLPVQRFAGVIQLLHKSIRRTPSDGRNFRQSIENPRPGRTCRRSCGAAKGENQPQQSHHDSGWPEKNRGDGWQAEARGDTNVR